MIKDYKSKEDLNPNEIKEDKRNILRPKKIEDFIGQDSIKSNLKTFIKSSSRYSLILVLPLIHL